MSNITRVKKGESLLSGKVLVTCTVTIIGLWSHSGTGEEWADDDNGMTSADAQAFKRACTCFGLGRYFYDIPAIWVDLDQHRHPMRTLVLSAWALPLDERILGLEKAVGTAFYRNILREYGRVNQPELIRDAAVKRKVLQMLESVARGIDRPLEHQDYAGHLCPGHYASQAGSAGDVP